MRMDYVGERTLKADGWNRWMGGHDTTLKWMGACQYIHPKQFKLIFPKTRCSSANFICFCLSVMQLQQHVQTRQSLVLIGGRRPRPCAFSFILNMNHEFSNSIRSITSSDQNNRYKIYIYIYAMADYSINIPQVSREEQ